MKKILITSSIRQSKEVIRKYLKSINELHILNCKVDKMFILHNCYDKLKYEFSDDIKLIEINDKTEDVRNEKTHNWKKETLNTISNIKNKIVAYSLENNYDYTFWIDSDLILHPVTLIHLFNELEKRREYIISEIFWTDWQNDGIYGSNAWEYDFYSGDQTRYKIPGIYQVGGTGACILVNNKVYKSGINYSPLPNLPITNWEDRAFCIKATCYGYKIFLDTHFPATHLYRE